MQLWKKTSKVSISNSEKEIDVVLSSSGVRAPAFIGALKGLIEKGYSIKRIAGTSGGAIIAAGYALGLSIEEMESYAHDVDYKVLKDFSIRNLGSLRNPSLYSGKPLDELYKNLFGNATLKDFKIDCKITVVTVGGGRRRIVLDKNTHPDLLVWEAVRMSSSIPFIFPYKTLDGRPVTDGGLVVYDRFDIFPDNARPTICLRPRSSTVRKGQDNDDEIKVYLWTLIRAVVGYLFDAVENQEISVTDWDKTILIPTGTTATFNFDLTESDVNRLLEYGYNAVMQTNVVPNLNPN